MKAILSYHPSCGVELLSFNDSKEELRNDCWLVELVKKEIGNNSIIFLGRDSKKRIEIEMDVNTFTKLQNNPLFIMKSEKLRRLRTTRKDVLDFLLNSNINIIDNDLDDENN